MRLFLVILVVLTASLVQANSCEDKTIRIAIRPDGIPSEVAFKLATIEDSILLEVELDITHVPGELYSWEVCVDAAACVIFTITDDFGDGLTGSGEFQVYEDDVLVIDDPDYTFSYSNSLGCAEGKVCNSADSIVEGNYTTSFDDHWYAFTPDSSGQYLITTCGLSTCDTKIWVYDNCDLVAVNEDNTGTIFYGDNYGNCGEQANLKASLSTGLTYYIRIGDDHDVCGDELQWSIGFYGYISGCTDSTACNYNPAATIDDGSCMAPSDPDCPEGPDLVLVQGELETSMYLTTIEATDQCWINEGCLNGYGMRDIIRFTTKIENNGGLDYYVGPQQEGAQFTYDNCHNHWHYDGYAEYLLFDEAGQKIPIGFKNGFCVIDLGCEHGGSSQYYCNNMGITAGCYDAYHSSLECQWIDITDVPDGDYTFVARVNWDNAPDVLGRYEIDTVNNWAQVCINIDRSSGQIQFSKDSDCPIYYDCEGNLLGNAQIDCEGNCAGTALMGDLDFNGLQDSEDLFLYIAGAVGNALVPTGCNNLSGDDGIDIYDVALMKNCLSFGMAHDHTDTGPHDHCSFPRSVTAINEAASLAIVDFVPGSHLDIGLLNPNSNVIGFQFEMSGIAFSAVENLVDSTVYNVAPFFDFTTHQILAVSDEAEIIPKSLTWQPLVRIYYSATTANEICISNLVGIVNDKVEKVPSIIEGDCIVITGIHTQAFAQPVTIFPNPTSNAITLNWTGNRNYNGYELINIQGKSVQKTKLEMNSGTTISLERFMKGIYWLKLVGEDQPEYSKVVLQ